MEIQNQVWQLDQVLGQSTSAGDPALLASALCACIVLNAPALPHDVFRYILCASVLRICADGGANVFFISFFEGDNACSLLPSAIVGDLDSIRPEIFDFFDAKGVIMSKIVDQDHTDLEKALNYVEENLGGNESHLVAILGSIGSHEGRIDQFFAVINAMFRYRNSPSMRLVQVGKESVMILLNEGKHIVNVPRSAIDNHCGLIPMFVKVDRLVTSGLEWDFTEALGPSYFGGIVSTNNIIRSGSVEIETSHPILFTITYR